MRQQPDGFRQQPQRGVPYTKRQPPFCPSWLRVCPPTWGLPYTVQEEEKTMFLQPYLFMVRHRLMVPCRRRELAGSVVGWGGAAAEQHSSLVGVREVCAPLRHTQPAMLPPFPAATGSRGAR